MPDITMCFGEGCERRDDCFRFLAEPSDFMQAYFAKPGPLKDGNCPHFWSAKVEASKKKVKAR